MSDADRGLRQDLERCAADQGARAFGVADLAPLLEREPRLLEQTGPGFTRALVAGVRLQAAVLETVTDRPSPLYFHHYRQANNRLDALAFAVADRVREAGGRALPLPATQIVARHPMRGHLSHKLLGWAAGLGYFGRSSLLVHPRFGAQLRYVSVLTDLPIPADRPVPGDCGSCRACVAVCPAGAIRETREAFDLEACYRKLTEFTRLPFVGQHVCGVCVKACRGSASKSREINDGTTDEHGSTQI
jgi:epoxyqueuosine reductase